MRKVAKVIFISLGILVLLMIVAGVVEKYIDLPILLQHTDEIETKPKQIVGSALVGHSVSFACRNPYLDDDFYYSESSFFDCSTYEQFIKPNDGELYIMKYDHSDDMYYNRKSMQDEYKYFYIVGTLSEAKSQGIQIKE